MSMFISLLCIISKNFTPLYGCVCQLKEDYEGKIGAV